MLLTVWCPVALFACKPDWRSRKVSHVGSREYFPFIVPCCCSAISDYRTNSDCKGVLQSDYKPLQHREPYFLSKIVIFNLNLLPVDNMALGG